MGKFVGNSMPNLKTILKLGCMPQSHTEEHIFKILKKERSFCLHNVVMVTSSSCSSTSRRIVGGWLVARLGLLVVGLLFVGRCGFCVRGVGCCSCTVACRGPRLLMVGVLALWSCTVGCKQTLCKSLQGWECLVNIKPWEATVVIFSPNHFSMRCGRGKGWCSNRINTNKPWN